MKIRRYVPGLVFFALSFTLFFNLFQGIIPKSDSRLRKQDFLKNRPLPTLTYVAIGDSLTQGVGDRTGQGGFVGLLAQSLDQDKTISVAYDNFGKGGNTSNQILKRMKTDEAIQNRLSQADVMTLTVGGNDVMAVIRKNLANLKLSQFKKAQKSYQKRLRAIIDQARAEQPDLPIYVLGIYNPFYLNFPEMTEMQEVIDNWNASTEAVTKEYEGVYFVPINDLLYKGIDGQGGIVSEGQGQTSVINNALFEQDNFHPNTIGYRLMANAVKEAIDDTKSDWPKKKN